MIHSNIKTVVLSTYAVNNPIRCEVVSLENHQISLKTENDCLQYFSAFDPVVCIFEDNHSIKYASGEIKGIDAAQKTICIQLLDDNAADEKRSFERYPISISADIRKKYNNKRHRILARNISETGICVQTSLELDKNDDLDIDLYIDNSMVLVSGKVVWKTPKGSNYEYGVFLTHSDKKSLSIFKSYFDKINSMYAKFYEKANKSI